MTVIETPLDFTNLSKVIRELEQDSSLYRLYPDGSVVHQDDFADCDERYDDYALHRVPDDPLEMVLLGKRGLPEELVAHIMDSFTN